MPFTPFFKCIHAFLEPVASCFATCIEKEEISIPWNNEKVDVLEAAVMDAKDVAQEEVLPLQEEEEEGAHPLY